MVKFYPTLLDRLGLSIKQVKYPDSLLERRVGHLNSRLCYFLILLFSFLGNNYTIAQTILINPATNGGFESGATFAANGWSVSNSANNPWVIGTAVATAPFAGNSAYISNNAGVANAYTPDNESSNFFWRDVVIPAGETKIALSFNWNCQGESNWDNWQVFYATTAVTPIASAVHPGSGTTNVPAGIAGATFIGFGQTTTGVQTANYSLPAALAGTTVRLIFSWKNETGGTQPPAAIDNISLTSQAPGNYVSIASGNWSSPSTWDSGVVPSGLDHATVSVGHAVTLDATGQAAKNVTVNGILTYSPVPGSFAVMGNLTVNAGGFLNVFNGATGKTISVAGDLVNNGTIDLSVGTGSAGNLTLNGPTVQSISGNGIFVNDMIRNLVFNNTSLVIPNINWLVNNISIDNTLNISNAKINLGANKLTSGTSITSTGTFTFTNGGFMPGGKFSRWWTAGATGYTTASPTSVPTGQAGRYPYYTLDGQQRIFYLGRTLPTVGGQYAVVYNTSSTITTGLSIADGAYIVTDRWNGNFVVSTESNVPAAQSYFVSIFAPNLYSPLNGVGRVLGQSAAISGTHLNSTAGASAQRSGVLEADLLSNTGLYMGINTADLLFASIASGDWNSPATWNKGVVPACTDSVIISFGNNVTVNSAGNSVKGITVTAGGILTVTSGDLLVGCTLNNNALLNNGTVTVSGGLLIVNGNINNSTAASIFNQSGGTIKIDGNDAGIVANSVASGTALFGSSSTNINLTGGTLLFVDPHAAATNTSGLAINLSNATASTLTLATSAAHIMQFGDGISTDAGGHANGFYINNWADTAYLSLGSIIVNGGTGTNRKVSSVYALTATGNVTVNAASNLTSDSLIIGGNLTVNAGGEFLNVTSTNCSKVASNTGSSLVPAPVVDAQTFTNNGTILNLATGSTANFASFVVNNTNTTGVTLASPFSVSGTLGLTAGKINTTTATLLTVGTATAAGTITGGSATAYVNGPLSRVIASGNTSYISFPVGKGTYAPIALAPTTTALSSFKAETFDSNPGSNDASIIALSGTRRWEASLVSGTFTDINVRLTDAGLLSTSIPVQAPSAAGSYSNAFGSLATYAAGPPATTQSNTAIAAANFTGFVSYANSNVCSGTPTPGTTLATATQICLGTSVTFSLQNTTPGTGVTYAWESSADGVVYAPIVDATNATLTTVPTAAGHYRAQVTCAGNTGTSIAAQITFSNSITAAPVSRCGTGTVSLEATGSAGTTVKWYAAASGGAAIGTGTPFESPSISTTTTFYAAAETASVGSSALGNGSLTSSSVAETFFPGSWGGTKTQYIIRASELTAAGLTAGNINSLGFEATNSGQTYQGFFVNIGHTSNTTAPTSTFIASGLTQVYAGTEANDGFTPLANTVNTLTFGLGTGSASSFNWDGTSNIVVSISWSRVPAASTASSSGMKVDNVGFVSSAYRQRDNVTPAAMLAETSVNTTGSVRPKFILNGQVICSSPRVAVAATVTVPPVLTLSANPGVFCEGQSSSVVTIVAGGSDYDTFVWSSPAEVSGDATNGWSFAPTATKNYTLTASQSGGTLCGVTATVVVNVNPLPTALTIAAPAPVCANTILPLTVTGGESFGSNAIIGTDTTLTGATAQPTAFCNRWPNYWSQTIYTAAELTAAGLTAGNIASLAYNIATLGDGATNSAFTIKIGATSDSSFASTTFAATTNYTTVYGPATYTHSASGWQQIVFSTPYAWDGISNIIINVTHNGADSANNAQTYYTATALPTTLWATSFTGTTTAGNTSPNRLNIKFVPQLPVTTSWLPITNLYSDAAATLPYVADANTKTVYFKSAAAGATTYTVSSENDGTGCTRTATVGVTVNALPSLVVANPATVCSPSTVDITAAAVTAGSDAGLTFSYWADPNATVIFPGPGAITSSGTFYIKATNANSCSVVSPVVVTVNALPSLVVANPAAVCSPSTVDITAAAVTAGSDAGLTLSYWADPNATVTFPGPDAITSSGTFYIKATNSNSCSVVSPVVVTVNPLPSLLVTNPAAVCSLSTVDITAAAVTAGSDAGLTLSYWADPNATVTFPGADAITSSGTFYIKATNANSCSVVSPVVVTVNPLPSLLVTNPAAVCSPSTVDITAAAVTAGSDADLTLSYWADPNATVTFPGPDAITSSGTFYIKATNANSCSVILPVVVTVNALPLLVVTNPGAVCSSDTVDITAAAVTAGSGAGLALSYWADPNATVTFPGPDAITSSGTFYIKAENASGCSVILPVAVVVKEAVEAPTTTTPIQDFTTGDDLTDFEVTGSDLIWYDAATDGNVLPSTTIITTGTVYYVSQTVDGCESPARLMITAGVDLRTQGFDSASLKYYPNPVTDFLTVTYSGTIESIAIFNVLGQKVYQKTHHSQEVKVDMSSLATGNYIVNVMANGLVKTIKVIKK